ncbi:MAG: Glycine--tRNA ligase 1, mitochondrial [Thelocarpon superellum]|nr:MAG: Glycine--tRNA ligase 1, mitochondrial [Thelocarpon superellum]
MEKRFAETPTPNATEVPMPMLCHPKVFDSCHAADLESAAVLTVIDQIARAALVRRPSLCRGITSTGPGLFNGALRPRSHAQVVAATTKTGGAFDRSSFDALLRRRLFYTPAFEVYGGVSGLYDYGPPGCALQANIIDLWRKHFVLEEDMLEVDCAVLTPQDVLKTSGHVDRFADWLCKDPSTGEVFRADHLITDVLHTRLRRDREARVREEERLADGATAARPAPTRSKSKGTKLEEDVIQQYEAVLAKIEDCDGPELARLIEYHQITNPATGEKLSPPTAFNLMFPTSIGPSTNMPGYLRPETAQGQFLNFQKLYLANQQSMPFASASIGKCFRNEIAPRSGLLRVREFMLAEIEHYIDPAAGKRHDRFGEVRDVTLAFLPRAVQQDGRDSVERMSIGQAVSSGIVDNETLGYFLARVQLFLEKVGIDASKLRFRQHMANEMAHYAVDCWDAEVLTSAGWMECVGCADRSAFDLHAHAVKTGAALTVRATRPEPLRVEEWQVDLEPKTFGPHFKMDGSLVKAALAALTQAQLNELARTLHRDGKITLAVPGVGTGAVELTRDMIAVVRRSRVEHVREYTPNVIEPSFGLGRILYSLMEHVYWTRSGLDDRGVLSFPIAVAPTKVLIAPLLSHASMKPVVRRLSQQLRALGVAHRVDESSSSIGRRYSRHDEIGTPLGLTVDPQSVQDGSLTLRDRDSMRQVRGSEADILRAIQHLVEGRETWLDVKGRLPEVLVPEVHDD